MVRALSTIFAIKKTVFLLIFFCDRSYSKHMKDETFYTLLNLALKEDLSEKGDVTSSAIFNGEKTEALLVSKDSGILCGSEYFKKVYEKIDSRVVVTFLKSDGDALVPGDKIALVAGEVKSVLSGERIAINFLAFLSGIASETRRLMDIASSCGKVTILDTRKTLPGYRELSKYAVRTGGGKNHRMGLYDMVLIKDNHIDCAKGITNAVQAVRMRYGNEFRIEVETRNLSDVKEALSLSVDVIMLDNMTVDECKEALSLERGKTLFEASGNFDEEKILRYGALNLDFISIGKLTHSVKAFDYSLRIPQRNS